MDNENKWEYDYSSQDKNESGDTGYPNVGSSGMNTANQYNDPQPEPEAAYTAPQTDNGAGGATPPVHPVQPRRGAGAGRSHGLCGRLCGGKVWRQRQGGHSAGGTFLYGRQCIRFG